MRRLTAALLLLATLLAVPTVLLSPAHATVSTTTARWNYTGNASTTVFPYTNKVYASSDLAVYVDGVLQTLTTHYSVSGVGVVTGGNVTFVSAPASATKVVILSNIPITQTTSLTSVGAFSPTSVEQNGLDRIVRELQQVNERVNRAPLLPLTTTQTGPVLGAPGASQFIRWNAAGTELEPADLPTLTGAAVSALASYAKADLPSGAAVGTLARVTDDIRGVWIKLASGWVSITGVANVQDFGAVGDDTNDDSEEIQAAFDAIPATGATAYFPCGVYKHTLNLTINGSGRDDVVLKGAGAGCARLKSYVPSGTALYINNTALANTTMDRVVIEDLGFEGTGNEGVLVRCDFCRWAQLTRIWITGSGGDGLWIGRGQDFTLSHSLIQAHAGWGVRVDKDGAVSAAGNFTRILDNTIKGNTTGNLLIASGSEHEVRGNQFESAPVGVRLLRNRTTLIRNVFEGHTTMAIELGDGTSRASQPTIALNSFGTGVSSTNSINLITYGSATFLHNLIGSPMTVTFGSDNNDSYSTWTGRPGDISAIINNASPPHRTVLLLDSVGDIQSFTSLDTTPSVMGGPTFTTANASATSITNFDHGRPGQWIAVRINDSNTTFVHSTNAIDLQGGADIAATSGDWYFFVATLPTVTTSTLRWRHIATTPERQWKARLAKQTLTIAADGAGTAAAANLTPTRPYVEIDCQDTDGCDVTMIESSAVEGEVIRIVNISANTVNFADTSGVSETASTFAAGQWDALSLIYEGTRWVELSRSNN